MGKREKQTETGQPRPTDDQLSCHCHCIHPAPCIRVITFVALAILLWMLGTSLASPEGFDTVVAIMDNFLVKLVLWGILTALAYHIVGGLRHLVMDMGYWEELESGNQSARVAFVITAILAVLAGVLVW